MSDFYCFIEFFWSDFPKVRLKFNKNFLEIMNHTILTKKDCIAKNWLILMISLKKISKYENLIIIQIVLTNKNNSIQKNRWANSMQMFSFVELVPTFSFAWHVLRSVWMCTIAPRFVFNCFKSFQKILLKTLFFLFYKQFGTSCIENVHIFHLKKSYIWSSILCASI